MDSFLGGPEFGQAGCLLFLVELVECLRRGGKFCCRRIRSDVVREAAGHRSGVIHDVGDLAMLVPAREVKITELTYSMLPYAC